jgi:hypothetical protein
MNLAHVIFILGRMMRRKPASLPKLAGLGRNKIQKVVQDLLVFWGDIIEENRGMVFAVPVAGLFGTHHYPFATNLLGNDFVRLGKGKQEQDIEPGHDLQPPVHAAIDPDPADILGLGDNIKIFAADLKRKALFYPGASPAFR